MRFSFPGRTSAFPFAFVATAFSLFLVFAGSCSRPPQADPAAIRAGIEQVDRDLMAAFAARDARAIGLLYTEDGKLMPPNAESALGREAIAKVWESFFELPIPVLRIETDEVFGSGDAVTAEGHYALVGADSQAVEVGKYMAVYRKTEAGWRLHRDMWSSNAPATAPALPDSASVISKK